MSYITPDELLANISTLEPPTKVDSLDLFREGVLFHVYGVLHGISGGTNADYRQFVNDTIKDAPGLKLGEKGMTRLYKGLDGELEDWGAVPYTDIVKLTLAIHGLPWRSFKFVKTLIREKLQRTDRFKKDPSIKNIGGSRYFHLLNPFERRILAGFPQSTQYLYINIDRRHKVNNFKLPDVFDRDWEWLNWIEPYANLPLRSIFMIEYAQEMARLTGVKEISLFVGETHNTDIATYLDKIDTPSWPHESLVFDTVHDAQKTARLVHSGQWNLKRLDYISGIGIGMCLPFFVYVNLIIGLKHLLA